MKTEILEACRQPGASVASVALAYGVNANMVHRWRAETNAQERGRRRQGELQPAPGRAVGPRDGAVRHGDDQWFDIVKWKYYALLNAEELGITKANVEEMKNSENPEIKRILSSEAESKIGTDLGLTNDWVVNIVKTTGDYGEIFEKNVGSGSPLKIARGINALWTKGETSGHYLELVDIATDCDADTLLVRAIPHGPTCHNGTASCFADAAQPRFLDTLEALIAAPASTRREGSYTTKLLEAGPAKVAQKVGEEGVEVALAAVTRDDAGLLDECADLVFHLLALLRSRGLSFAQVEDVLAERHASAKSENPG